MRLPRHGVTSAMSSVLCPKIASSLSRRSHVRGLHQQFESGEWAASPRPQPQGHFVFHIFGAPTTTRQSYLKLGTRVSRRLLALSRATIEITEVSPASATPNRAFSVRRESRRMN